MQVVRTLLANKKSWAILRWHRIFFAVKKNRRAFFIGIARLNIDTVGGIWMNILFFLTPKKDIAYLYEEDTLRQALEKMEHRRYSCVPIINRAGKYIGTITEGDLLWGIKNKLDLNLKEAESISITIISRRNDYNPVNIDTTMEDLMEKALNQNFVPVVDDQENFIGIVTRKDIIRYLSDHLFDKEDKAN